MKKLVLFGCLLLLNAQAVAEVTIANGWVRASAPGQQVGAAYMTLTSKTPTSLVYVEASVSDSTEIHSMSMDNGVMKMRSLEELVLAPNTPVKLAPGGYHLMLIDLKEPLKVGGKVKFRLCFKDKQNQIAEQEITLPIKEAR
jgi:copper(I)-binding protein